MKNIVVKNIKYLFQIYFVMKIYLSTINIFFVRYEGIFETNIFLKGIFDANIFLKGIFYTNIPCAEAEKKRIFSVISVPNL